MVRKSEQTSGYESIIPELGKLSQHVKAEDKTGCHIRPFRTTGSSAHVDVLGMLFSQKHSHQHRKRPQATGFSKCWHPSTTRRASAAFLRLLGGHSSPGNTGVEVGALLWVLPQCQSSSPSSAFSTSKASPHPELGPGLQEGLVLRDGARLSSVLRHTQPLPQHCKHCICVNILREFCPGRLQVERKKKVTLRGGKPSTKTIAALCRSCSLWLTATILPKQSTNCSEIPQTLELC